MPDTEYLKRCKPETRDKTRRSRLAAERRRRARRRRAKAIDTACHYTEVLRLITNAKEKADYYGLDQNLRSAIDRLHGVASRHRERNLALALPPSHDV